MGIVRELSVYPRLLTRILPLVERELRRWRAVAAAIHDTDLRNQALASLEKKKFHCVGGAVLALMGERATTTYRGGDGLACGRSPQQPAQGPQEKGRGSDMVADLVRSIVAIQTISDYLDNLCDRSLVAARVAGHAGDSLHGTKQLCPGNSVHWAEQMCASNSIHWAKQPYAAYLQLHESMLCAVDPERPVSDYYAAYLPLVEGSTGEVAASRGGQDGPRLFSEEGRAPGPRCVDGDSPDGGYLDALVEASRKTLRGLPGYTAARPFALELVSLYSELQAGKHMPLAVRDEIMERWFGARYLGSAQPIWPSQPPESWLRQSGAAAWLGRDLHWWEFGAATGSTLAVFALLCASIDPAFSARQAKAMTATYFPAICGLHILLDYYIDQAEDVEGGDLNFISYYGSAAEATRALECFTRWSLSEAQRCAPFPWLHTAVVRGLLAMYLSDPKVERQGLGGQASVLTKAGQGVTPSLKTACSMARKFLRF
ncbi:MAG: DUF2600 family protein [Bacillota bacterium]